MRCFRHFAALGNSEVESDDSQQFKDTLALWKKRVGRLSARAAGRIDEHTA